MLKMINIILQQIIINKYMSLLDIKSDQQIIIIDSWSREIIIKVIHEMRWDYYNDHIIIIQK